MPEPTPVGRLDSVFCWGGGNLKFGLGAIDELGHDIAGLGVDRVLVVTDPGVQASGVVDRVTGALGRAGISSARYGDVEVEPTDQSIQRALEAVRCESFAAIVAIGGGSVIDTAKAVNLLYSCGGELIDYVNLPIGGGRRPSGQVLPLVAVPTTAGSGSESSAVCVMDLLSRQVKAGISDWRLRPTLAVIDPEATSGLPRQTTISSGLDVLCHTLESLTARPFDARLRPRPGTRPTFSGANPFSDLLCERALQLIARSLRRAVHDGADSTARYNVMLAATLTAVGSSTAGVHIPHACSYAIASRGPDYLPKGAGVRRRFVPHGMAVAATVRASLEFTFPADPARHLHLAQMLAQPNDGLEGVPERERLSARLSSLLHDLDTNVELCRFGYGPSDIAALVEGTMLQRRLLVGAPREVGERELAEVLTRSLC